LMFFVFFVVFYVFLLIFYFFTDFLWFFMILHDFLNFFMIFHVFCWFLNFFKDSRAFTEFPGVFIIFGSRSLGDWIAPWWKAVVAGGPRRVKPKRLASQRGDVDRFFLHWGIWKDTSVTRTRFLNIGGHLYFGTSAYLFSFRNLSLGPLA